MGRDDLKDNESDAGGIQGDALSGPTRHFDLNVPSSIEGVVTRVGSRMQREAQSLSGDDLSNRPDKVPVRRELSTKYLYRTTQYGIITL